jgi:hypothetical protein
VVLGDVRASGFVPGNGVDTHTHAWNTEESPNCFGDTQKITEKIYFFQKNVSKFQNMISFDL